MAEDPVEENVNPSGVRLVNQFPGVRERAKVRIDFKVVAGVVSGSIQLQIKAGSIQSLLRRSGVRVEDRRHPNP